MRDVEHAAIVTHRMVLLDLGTVVDRHVPAAKIDHPGVERAVGRIQNRFLQHINPLQTFLTVSSRNGKGETKERVLRFTPLS